ncbi:hypothetical protein [Bdellovibrio sp. HCB2-146]|uniref:hypothetical protein n=1 Tax=Bdellovibrio sp. HCB2-146 TaxID=3394362 RepID=UPI0039BD6B95
MFWLSWIFASTAVWAATPEQILKTAWTDQTYLVHDEIKSTDSKNPFRSVDAFASTEDKSKPDTEVGLKFQLKSWPEWRSGRSRLGQQRLQKESALSWALRDRYGLLANYQLNQQKLKLLSEAKATSEAFSKAQALSLKAGRSTQKTFLNAQSEEYKLKRMENTIELEQEILKDKIQRWLGADKDKSLESYELVSVDDIYKAVKETAPEGSLTAKLAGEELTNIGQELEIVRGRENQWVKSFEVSHVKKPDESHYQFEVTLQLPPFGSDDMLREKQNELILKKALKQREIENTGDRLKIMRLQILNLVEIYQIEKKKRGSFVKGADPLVNLEAKLTSLEEQVDLLNQQQEVTLLYLDYLLENESLAKEPEKNFLIAGKR